MQRNVALFLCAVLLCLTSSLRAAFDKRFDICTIYNTADGGDPHFTTTNLSHLNFTTTNGHMICMPTDSQRSTINGAGMSLRIIPLC